MISPSRLSLSASPTTKANEVHLGDYQFLKTIGKGQFAEVRLARHLRTNVEVAIKIISKSMFNLKNLHKLFQEVKIMKQLNHSNIVKLFQAIETSQALYLVMKYEASGTLLDFVLKNYHTHTTERDKIIMFRQLAEALNHIHLLSIAHRDLKMENILLCLYGNIRLGDFGFARQMASRLQRSSSFCGTKPYLSPEIVRHQEYDPFSCDWYSAGIVFYTLLSGRWPFDIDDVKEDLPLPQIRYPLEVFSNDAIQLLKRLIQDDPYLRADYQMCLRSPLMCKYKQGIGHPVIMRDSSTNLFKTAR